MTLQSKARESMMRKHQLKMNRPKSFLRVSSSKLLGFIMTSKGHLDPIKVKAIQEIQPHQNLKELRGLQGRLTYIQWYITNLSRWCQLFTKLIKKGVSFIWDEVCQHAFKDIKNYLTKPHILMAPTLGRPFLIYVRAMDHAFGALLAQHIEQG